MVVGKSHFIRAISFKQYFTLLDDVIQQNLALMALKNIEDIPSISSNDSDKPTDSYCHITKLCIVHSSKKRFVMFVSCYPRNDENNNKFDCNERRQGWTESPFNKSSVCLKSSFAKNQHCSRLDAKTNNPQFYYRRKRSFLWFPMIRNIRTMKFYCISANLGVPFPSARQKKCKHNFFDQRE